MSEHVDNSHDYEQASEVSLLSFFMHPAVQAKIRNLESVVGDAPENSSMRADCTRAAVEAAYELIPVEKFANKDIVVYGQIFTVAVTRISTRVESSATTARNSSILQSPKSRIACDWL